MTAPSALQRLDSHGATLLVLPEPSFGLVRCAVALRRGAADGPPAVLACMLELLLRGTRTRDRHAFAVALERLGSSIDAACGHEAAMLRGVCLSHQLTATWSLLCEAWLTPRLAADELASLADEGAEALMAERDEDDAVAELFCRQALYPGHPLGTPPGGDMAQLAAVTPAAVRAAHARLAAEDLVIAFAGDVEVEAGVALAAELTGALPRRAPPSTAVAAVAPPPLARSRVVLVDKPGRTQVQLRLAGLGPAATAGDVEAFWLGIVAFGGTFTSPFTRAVRDERGWSYTAHADFRRRSRLGAPVVLRSAPALADAPACLRLEIDLWAQLRGAGLPAAACAQAQQYVLNRYPFEVATAFDRAVAALSQELLGLPLADLAGTEARLAACGPADIGAALSRCLQPGHYVAVLVGPAAALQAPLADALKGAADAPDVQVVDYRAGLLARTCT